MGVFSNSALSVLWGAAQTITAGWVITSAGSLRFNDDTQLVFGTGSDFNIQFISATSKLTVAVGDEMVFRVAANVKTSGNVMEIGYDTAETITTTAVHLLDLSANNITMPTGGTLAGVYFDSSVVAKVSGLPKTIALDVLAFQTNDHYTMLSRFDGAWYRGDIMEFDITAANSIGGGSGGIGSNIINVDFNGTWTEAGTGGILNVLLFDATNMLFSLNGSDEFHLVHTLWVGNSNVTLYGLKISSYGNVMAGNVTGLYMAAWKGGASETYQAVHFFHNQAPSAATNYYGLHFQHSGNGGSAILQAVRAIMPTSYSSLGANTAVLYGEGDARIAAVLDTDYGFRTSVASNYEIGLNGNSQIIDIDLDIWATGTIASIAYTTAETITGTVKGYDINFQTNVTNNAGAMYGIDIAQVGFNTTAGDAPVVYGFNFNVGNSTVNHASAFAEQYGILLTFNNITLTAGTMNSFGIYITMPSIISGSPTSQGLRIDMKTNSTAIHLKNGDTTSIGIDMSEGWAVDEITMKFVADAITTAGTVSHQIAIDIGGTTYYLVAYTHGT